MYHVTFIFVMFLFICYICIIQTQCAVLPGIYKSGALTSYLGATGSSWLYFIDQSFNINKQILKFAQKERKNKSLIEPMEY